ncbi:hypothetical protein [Gelidibacter sp.]|uniref:hypothetical protein n=1 Tax=Gelidibacter sp. TaxID=2018083 RepID=UPI00326799CE
MRFHTIISEFRDKLESSRDQEKITHVEIAAFYNKLNNFDLKFVLFSKYYRKYIDNLNRLKPQPEDKNPDLTLLRVALAENEWKPTTPFAIFIHHLKYDNKVTSKPFIAYQKRQNRNKLNAPATKVKEVEKPKKSEKWTRVPIPRHHPPRKLQ